MVDSVNGVGGTNQVKKITDPKVWQQMTAGQIIKENATGDVPPREVLEWAKQMAAMNNATDDVTYAQGQTQAADKPVDPAAATGQNPQNTVQSEYQKTGEEGLGVKEHKKESGRNHKKDEPLDIDKEMAPFIAQVDQMNATDKPAEKVGEVKEPEKTDKKDSAKPAPEAPQEKSSAPTEQKDNKKDTTLADKEITSDSTEILKRKERKGVQS